MEKIPILSQDGLCPNYNFSFASFFVCLLALKNQSLKRVKQEVFGDQRAQGCTELSNCLVWHLKVTNAITQLLMAGSKPQPRAAPDSQPFLRGLPEPGCPALYAAQPFPAWSGLGQQRRPLLENLAHLPSQAASNVCLNHRLRTGPWTVPAGGGERALQPPSSGWARAALHRAPGEGGTGSSGPAPSPCAFPGPKGNICLPLSAANDRWKFPAPEARSK